MRGPFRLILAILLASPLAAAAQVDTSAAEALMKKTGYETYRKTKTGK